MEEYQPRAKHVIQGYRQSHCVDRAYETPIRRCATQQGMVFASESGTGSTNQHFCLEQGILFVM